MKNPTDSFPLGKPASNKDHWLVFLVDAVTGCHCGFEADEWDEGYGDSVVDHLIEVGIAWGRHEQQ